MKKPFFILLIMLLCQIWSCSKPKPNEWQTTVNARAVEYNTTVPVSNASVLLFAGGRIQAETVTNALGQFQFDFIATPGVVYKVLVTPDTLHTKKRYFQTRVWHINEGQSSRFDYPVTPYAYAKIHVKNINGVDRFDKFVISYLLPNDPEFYGKNVDTTFIGGVSANQNLPFNKIIYRGGTEIVIRDTIKVIPAHDTTFVEMQY
jgi:hypothetical protein